jgi:hypothetical protein
MEESYDYVGDITDHLICMICQEVFRSPVLCTTCDAGFCRSCLTDWVGRSDTCPKCRRAISFDRVSNSFVGVSNAPRLIHSLIGQLQVHCTHRNYRRTTPASASTLTRMELDDTPATTTQNGMPSAPRSTATLSHTPSKHATGQQNSSTTGHVVWTVRTQAPIQATPTQQATTAAPQLPAQVTAAARASTTTTPTTTATTATTNNGVATELFGGCQWTGSRDSLASHQAADCMYMPWQCPYNCGTTELIRRDRVPHMQHCSWRSITCECGQMVRVKELEHHRQAHCRHRLVLCACGINVPAQALEQHRHTCIFRQTHSRIAKLQTDWQRLQEVRFAPIVHRAQECTCSGEEASSSLAATSSFGTAAAQANTISMLTRMNALLSKVEREIDQFASQPTHSDSVVTLHIPDDRSSRASRSRVALMFEVTEQMWQAENSKVHYLRKHGTAPAVRHTSVPAESQPPPSAPASTNPTAPTASVFQKLSGFLVPLQQRQQVQQPQQRQEQPERIVIDVDVASSPVLQFEPPKIACNSTIRFSWHVRNSGSMAWPAGCHLVTFGDSSMQVSNLPKWYEQIAPGSHLEVAVTLQVPQKLGRHVAYFEIQTRAGLPVGAGNRLNATIIACEPLETTETVVAEHANQLECLREMGFTGQSVCDTLQQCGGDLDLAVEHLLANSSTT